MVSGYKGILVLSICETRQLGCIQKRKYFQLFQLPELRNLKLKGLEDGESNPGAK